MMWVRSAYDATRFLLNRRPNTRLKLPAPVIWGRIAFVKTKARRRSLSAIR